MVGIDELVRGVALVQESLSPSVCEAFDGNEDERVDVHELIVGVGNALAGCEAQGCPLAAGSYTLTQTAGGILSFDGLLPFDFSTGGRITMDVGPPSADCVHEAVVPLPGGFEVPPLCIAATNFTMRLTQLACGVGRVDSNGGSDFTLLAVGDTSDSLGVCDLAHPPGCAGGGDRSARADVTVGDGSPDVCSNGDANLIVSVPIRAQVWTSLQGCPDPDGEYDPESDGLVIDFNLTLDLTTDSSRADWRDLDGDGCFLAGSGPADPGFQNDGLCVDVANRNLVLTGSGVATADAPLFDLTFTTVLPGTMTGPNEPLNATCAAPPEINFDGGLTRCVGGETP